jgi:hypothetical protein
MKYACLNTEVRYATKINNLLWFSITYLDRSSLARILIVGLTIMKINTGCGSSSRTSFISPVSAAEKYTANWWRYHIRVGFIWAF